MYGAGATGVFDHFLSLRRKLDMDAGVSIVRDNAEREIRIYTDAGRICRPLFIVDHVSSSSSSEEENESVAEKEVTTDVKENCTIFVRDIPFDAYRHTMFMLFKNSEESTEYILSLINLLVG